jgi:polyphosphate glucokinase
MVTKSFVSELLGDDVVNGGGGGRKLRRLPMGCRTGENADALVGGFRRSEEAGKGERP